MKHILLIFSVFISLNVSAQFSNITPGDLQEDALLGFFIDIHGDELLIRASSPSSAIEDLGALYHYAHDGSEWKLNQKITPELPQDANRELFGIWFSMSDDWLATTIQDDQELESVIFYRKENDEWSRHSIITNDIPDIGFGWQVKVDGNLAVIGSVADFNDEGLDTGVAYIYEYDPAEDEWKEQQKLSPEELDVDDFFGSSIYLSGDLLAISARFDSEAGFFSGAVYVFEKEQGVWNLNSKLVPDDATERNYFGYRVDGDGEDRLIVSGYGTDNETGAAYIFKKENFWVQEARLTSFDLEEGDWFGSSVALEGNRAIVGARHHNGDDGAVFVFEHENGEWAQTRKFETPDDITMGRFGIGLDYENEKLVVGAAWANDLQGSVYALDFNDLTTVDERPEETMSLYPNPTKGEFQITSVLAKNSEILIYAADGTLVLTQLDSSSTLDVSSLAAGTYTVKVKHGERTAVVGKLVKID